MNLLEGQVKFYNRTKRFGFITAEDGKDYFFHESGIEPGNSVRDGDKVSFEIVEGDKGPKAEKVRVAGGSDEETSSDEPVEEETFDEDSSDEEE